MQHDPTRRLRRLVPIVLAALLVACGGGDDGASPAADPSQVQSPPATAAALGASSGDAASGARTAADAANAAAGNASSLSAVSMLFGTPIGGMVAAAENGRKQPLRVETSACDDLLESPCSGSATIDTNIADDASAIARGDYADIRFNAMTGRLDGNSISMNGRSRLDFQSALSLTSPQFAGLDVLVTLDTFSGSVNGVAFGPYNLVALLQINSQGASTVTAGGNRYSGVSAIAYTSAGTYSIGRASVRTAHWGSSSQYVDVSLVSWRVASGRPAVGSSATLSGASGSVTVRVSAASQASVVYAVAITSGGSTSNHVVTATYEASGVPTYAAVPG